MQATFDVIHSSDLVVVELTEKGVGLGIEAGYAFAHGKRIITIAEAGSDISETLKGISTDIIYYKDYNELELLLQNELEAFMVTVREYTSTDLEALTDLMTDLGSPSSLEEMRKRMDLIEANPYYATFVATIKDKVVGMAGVRLNITYTNNQLKTQISSLVTKKEYQEQGIGQVLIQHVEKWAQKKGSDFVYLMSGIREERLKAHEFYKNRGFEITGYRFVKRL